MKGAKIIDFAQRAGWNCWVIFQIHEGVKYYYIGAGNKFTTDIGMAWKYKKYPCFNWMSAHHRVMKI